MIERLSTVSDIPWNEVAFPIRKAEATRSWLQETRLKDDRRATGAEHVLRRGGPVIGRPGG